MRLGGWQRLWVVVSVLAAAMDVLVVFILRSADVQPEDPTVYAKLLSSEVTTVEIDTIGEVSFPSDLSKEEIGRLVKAAMSTTPPTVRAVAEDQLRQRAARKVTEARAANAAARQANLQLYAYGLVAWFIFIALLYAAGWSVDWVRRGFKAT